jgi:integrase/recombinase XerD
MRLERSLSGNTIDSYLRDISKLKEYLEVEGSQASPADLQLEDFETFLVFMGNIGLDVRSQARLISGIKAFYKYLLMEDLITENPTELLEAPKLSRKIPEVLTFGEIQAMLEAIDMSTPYGTRNRAMLETLYACGLRVSELINLKITNLFLDVGFIKVIGKSDKERLVPIGGEAIKHIENYMQYDRTKMNIPNEEQNFVFLNRRGKHLTRVYVFLLIKELAQAVGIQKKHQPAHFSPFFCYPPCGRRC